MSTPAIHPMLGRMTSLLFTLLLATDYRFATPNHLVTMQVHYEKPYTGQPLVFYQNGQRLCGTARCLEKFHGAVALVSFTIEKAHAKAPRPVSLREVVTITEQSADLPPADPFDLTLKIDDGRASDLQVLGYDEDEIPVSERERMREEAPRRMWRTARQELFLNGQRFAVIEWKHTMTGIAVASVSSPYLR